MEASLADIYSNIKYEFQERDISSDNSGDNSPSSTTFSASISSPKRSRRAIQKKVVTFPLKQLQGSRFKGDCTPPSDSWAWRKYGQKPIKGSPFPRGYYRCSSSKGCPARKQVERSRSDPNTLVVTYSYEHNHPWPVSRNNHHQNRHNNNPASTTTLTSTTENITTSVVSPTTSLVIPSSTSTNNSNTILIQPKIENNHGDHSNNTIIFQQTTNQPEPLIPPTNDLTWLSSDDLILENNSFFSSFADLDVAKIFPMREEDESLFADLGELPECSVVFRKAAGVVVAGEECKLAPATTWCGTTG